MKRKWIFSLTGVIAILWIGMFAAAKWFEHDLNRERPLAVAVSHDLSDPTDLKVYWNVPDFSFPDQDGKTVSNRDLLGHVWLSDFIFTQCTTACPVLTSKMILLQKHSPAAMRFVSFSVDPEHDTPAALKSYAQLWHGDESRWRLLSTTPEGLEKVSAGMKVTVAPSGDPDNPILHTTLFMLVDTQGRVRGVYDSSDSDAMARLQEDMQALAGGDSVNAVTSTGGSDVQRGQALFGSMGCLACHSRRATAPPLENVYGGMVRLSDGRMVWADDAYLHESIVDPPAKIVAGYTNSMPNYQSYLSDRQVMDLVAYVKSLSTNSPGGHGTVAGMASTQPVAQLAIDPVCKMQVTADASSPHVQFNGKIYYFCSDRCRQMFLKNPVLFAGTTRPVN